LRSVEQAEGVVILEAKWERRALQVLALAEQE
jgi:hypothetical protein